MSPRRQRPSLEDRLDQLSGLRREPDSPATLKALEKGLKARENLLAARAARVAGDLGKEELVPEMLAAFDRFMADPATTDKGCHAKFEIAKALVELDHPASSLFLRGIRHVQLEAAWGEPVDTAIELRANCAHGLTNSGHPNTVLELVPLLLDKGLPVRLAAARGIGASGQMAAEAVLRFKVLVGDEEPEVLTECLAGLLHLAPRRSIELIGPMLQEDAPRGSRLSRGTPRRHAAILALGESRLEEGAVLLEQQWRHCHDQESQRLVLLALVTSRCRTAMDFLVSLVAEGETADAREAITALAIHRHDAKIRDQLREALVRNPNGDGLANHFDAEFS